MVGSRCKWCTSRRRQATRVMSPPNNADSFARCAERAPTEVARRRMMLAWCSTIVGLSLPEGMGTPRRAAGPLGPSAGSSIPPVAPHLHDRVLKVKLHSAVLKFARGNDALLPPDMQQDQRDGFALGTRAGLEKAYHVRRRPGFCLTPGCQNLVESHVHHGCTVLHAR